MTARNVQRRPGEEPGAARNALTAVQSLQERSGSEPAYGPLEPVDEWTQTLPNGDLLVQQTYLRRVAR